MSNNKVITQQSQELNVPASEVWERLRKLDGLEEIIPEVIGKSWVIDGQEPGKGAQRACAMPGQSAEEASLVEKVLEFSDEDRFYSYTITQGVPVKNMLNSFKVDELADGRSKVIWEATMGEFIENTNMTQPEFEAFVIMNGEALMAGLGNIYNK